MGWGKAPSKMADGGATRIHQMPSLPIHILVLGSFRFRSASPSLPFPVSTSNMAGGSNKKLTKEEELLLQDFSRNVTTKSSALFYGNAFIVSAIPIWLFWRMHQMDPYQSAILFGVMTLISTYLLAFAYKHVKFLLKHKISRKREEAVSREVMKKVSDDKKMTKKEKDERVLWKKNEVADYEATTFSIFYNNALFLVLVICASFYLLRSFSPTFNYILSTTASASLVALFSTSTK